MGERTTMGAKQHQPKNARNPGMIKLYKINLLYLHKVLSTSGALVSTQFKDSFVVLANQGLHIVGGTVGNLDCVSVEEPMSVVVLLRLLVEPTPLAYSKAFSLLSLVAFDITIFSIAF